ncbi:MAG TPA: hypothetical protein VF034_16020 [Gemmatimonadaceae bacterium]|jgi:hypothetical protein
MSTRYHLRETTFRPRPAGTLTSLAATGTFLDRLPCSADADRTTPPPPELAELGVIIQLLTLRTIDGRRALEPELGIIPAADQAPAERFLVDGSVLAQAVRSTILGLGSHGERLQRGLFGPDSRGLPRVEITDLISLQRRWGAASNGMAAGTPVPCRVRAGVVLLGALRIHAPDLRSLALLFSALDRAATRGLPGAEQRPGPCQLDVLSIVGGAGGDLPSPAAILQGYESRFLVHPVTTSVAEPWPRARLRLDGRHARSAASQVARLSPFEVEQGLAG